MLEIIYRDEHLVAINKPHGLLVHRSSIAADASEFAIQMLRDQINEKVFPVHRLDRKTSGILLFALSKDVEVSMQTQFSEHKVEKEYIAIVRGYTDDRGEIDYPLRKENGTLQDAFTAYETLRRAEIPVAQRGHLTSRYSVVKAIPTTGRMHQIRKHMAHILHPIIGDRPHGCNKQNKFFKENWQMDTMLLHASRLSFTHPVTNNLVVLQAGFQSEFTRMNDLMGWGNFLT